MKKGTIAFLSFLAGIAGPLGAATIYDNGSPNHLGGSDMVLSLEADDFSVAALSTLSSVQFWDYETPGGASYAGSIFWSIYSNSSNNPGAVLFSGSASGANVTRVSTGILDPSSQFTEYSDTFLLSSGVTLGPGTYWLALHNGPLSPIDPNSPANFFWESTSLGCSETAFNVCGRAKDLTSAGAPFLSTLSENGFNITGTTVPEPGSLSLLGTALLGLMFASRQPRTLINNLWRKS